MFARRAETGDLLRHALSNGSQTRIWYDKA
jgi:hypothetical protein